MVSAFAPSTAAPGGSPPHSAHVPQGSDAAGGSSGEMYNAATAAAMAARYAAAQVMTMGAGSSTAPGFSSMMYMHL